MLPLRDQITASPATQSLPQYYKCVHKNSNPEILEVLVHNISTTFVLRANVVVCIYILIGSKLPRRDSDDNRVI